MADILHKNNKNFSSFTKAFVCAKAKKKDAVALAHVYPGTGKISIKHAQVNDELLTNANSTAGYILKPLEHCNLMKCQDIDLFVRGGGYSSQLKSMQTALAKAIILVDPTCKMVLKEKGFLVQDGRVKERRKFGLKKARKAPQFSKR